ncbi:hypothetical protein HU200_005204 [Digitaria exilis]|uniref:Uncharacterized protein n=1 Tax=Digitaria exilis TaxID=1010633 RepID=A0A835KSR9_9POAL|nr:hypothetical protein HU200_005204 [Digitaria exilis]
MPMAIADRVVLSPRIRVSMAIADAFLCLSFATLWLFFVAFATMVFWERTCGEECTEFHVWKLAAFLFACSFAYNVVLYMLPKIRPESDTEEPEKELRPRTVLGDSAFLGIHVLLVFIGRLIVGDMLLNYLTLKGSPVERIGFAILDGGALVFEFSYCFIIIPTLALRTRKMSRIRYPLLALSFPCIYVPDYLV